MLHLFTLAIKFCYWYSGSVWTGCVSVDGCMACLPVLGYWLLQFYLIFWNWLNLCYLDIGAVSYVALTFMFYFISNIILVHSRVHLKTGRYVLFFI